MLSTRVVATIHRNHMAETPSPEQPPKGDWLESRKMFFDSQKHLATLSSAIFVVIATLMRSSDHCGNLPILIRVALFLLILAPFCAFCVMIGVSNMVAHPPRHVPRWMPPSVGWFFLAVLSFVGGMACDVISGLR